MKTQRKTTGTRKPPTFHSASVRGYGRRQKSAILGFHLFGSGFLWVVLALLFYSNLLRGIFSCLLSFVVLIGPLSFLFTLIC